MKHPSAQPNLRGDAPYTQRFWIALVATGIIAGLTGGALMQLLYAVEHAAWKFRGDNLLEGASETTASHRVLMLLAAGIIVAVTRPLLRRFVGPPQEINGAIWHGDGRVSPWATLAYAVQSLLVVGMGVSLGREAAIKEAGGAIAGGSGQWAGLSVAQRRLLLACGVGAGMAAAYNVPLGGGLFAVEVLLGDISLQFVVPALVASSIATAASWTFLPASPVYRVAEYPLSVPLTVWAILVGPLLGAAAVLLVRSVGWANNHKPRGWLAIVAPIVTMLLLGIMAIWFPQLLGNGKDVVQLSFVDAVSIELLLALPALKLLITVACLGSGARGGLFTPTMTLGALLGGLLGHAWNYLWPGASMGCCAIVGSCAFLAAATQGPISAIVMVLELTRHLDPTMVPILLAVLGATLVYRRLESRSIYSARLNKKAWDAAPNVPGRT